MKVCPNQTCDNKLQYPDDPQGVFCPTCDTKMTIVTDGISKENKS